MTYPGALSLACCVLAAACVVLSRWIINAQGAESRRSGSALHPKPIAHGLGAKPALQLAGIELK